MSDAQLHEALSRREPRVRAKALKIWLIQEIMRPGLPPQYRLFKADTIQHGPNGSADIREMAFVDSSFSNIPPGAFVFRMISDPIAALTAVNGSNHAAFHANAGATGTLSPAFTHDNGQADDEDGGSFGGYVLVEVGNPNIPLDMKIGDGGNFRGWVSHENSQAARRMTEELVLMTGFALLEDIDHDADDDEGWGTREID